MLQITHRPSSQLAADATLRRSSPGATPATASQATEALARTAFACASAQSGMQRWPGIAAEKAARSRSVARAETLVAPGFGWLFAESGL